MISPSRSAVGNPGQWPRNAVSPNSGVASMWATMSGCSAAASAEAAGGWVWTIAATSLRAR